MAGQPALRPLANNLGYPRHNRRIEALMDRQGDDMGLQIRALRELVGGECEMELVPVVVGADPGACSSRSNDSGSSTTSGKVSGRAPFGSVA